MRSLTTNGAAVLAVLILAAGCKCAQRSAFPPAQPSTSSRPDCTESPPPPPSPEDDACPGGVCRPPADPAADPRDALLDPFDAPEQAPEQPSQPEPVASEDDSCSVGDARLAIVAGVVVVWLLLLFVR